MSICATLFANVDWTFILVAAVAQHFFSFFYYASLVPSAFCRLTANDKGVTAVDKAVQRHGMLKCVAISALCGTFRALFIVAVLNLLKLRETATCQMCAFLDAGLLVSAVTLIAQHGEFWAQRHWALQLLHVAGDVGSATVAALVLYYLM